MSKQEDEDTDDSFGFQGDFPYNITKAGHNLLPHLENLPSRQHITLFEDEVVEKIHMFMELRIQEEKISLIEPCFDVILLCTAV